MPKRILVIDDDKDIVERYKVALVKEGYEVLCAYDGEEGLEVLKNPATGGIDLVILDLIMPNMSGEKFLKELRKDPNLINTKVLVKSSYLYKFKRRKTGEGEWVEEPILTRIAKKAKKYKEDIKMVEKRRHDRYTETDPYPKLTLGYLAKILVDEVKEILGEK